MDKISSILRKSGFVILFAIVPLLVWPKFIVLSNLDWDWYKGIFEYTDFYTYYKSVGIGIASLLLTVSLIFEDWKALFKKIKDHKWSVGLLLTLIGLIVISSVFSEYPTVVRQGYIEHSQGFWAWINYVWVVFVIGLTYQKDDRMWIERCLLGSGFVITSIGVSQALGQDFFKTSLGQFFMGGGNGTEIKFLFGETFVYSTLANSNYMGLYSAVLLPIAINQVIQEKKIFKIAWGVFVILLSICLITSKSRGGFVGVSVAAILFILNYLNTQLGAKIQKLIHIAIALFVSVLLLAGSWYVFGDGTEPMHPDVSFKAETNTLQITVDGISYAAIYDMDNVDAVPYITDAVGYPVPVLESSDEFYIVELENVELFKYGYNLVNNQKNMIFKIDDQVIEYAVTAEGFERRTPYGLLIDEETPESIGFKGKETLGSARGYIWSRSIPLLKENILVGSGPDTFALEFPQHEYEMKYKLYGNNRIIVDKSHNLILQMIIEIGGVAAGLIIAGLGYLAFVSCKEKSILPYLLSLVASLTAFMFSDLTVLTAPFVIAIVGILYGSVQIENKAL